MVKPEETLTDEGPDLGFQRSALRLKSSVMSSCHALGLFVSAPAPGLRAHRGRGGVMGPRQRSRSLRMEQNLSSGLLCSNLGQGSEV